MARVAVVQIPGVNCEYETVARRSRPSASRPASCASTSPRPRSANSTRTCFPAASRSRIACARARWPRSSRRWSGSPPSRRRGSPCSGSATGPQVLVEAGLVPGIRQRPASRWRWRRIALRAARVTSAVGAGCARTRGPAQRLVRGALADGRGRAASHRARRGPFRDGGPRGPRAHRKGWTGAAPLRGPFGPSGGALPGRSERRHARCGGHHQSGTETYSRSCRTPSGPPGCARCRWTAKGRGASGAGAPSGSSTALEGAGPGRIPVRVARTRGWAWHRQPKAARERGASHVRLEDRRSRGVDRPRRRPAPAAARALARELRAGGALPLRARAGIAGRRLRTQRSTHAIRSSNFFVNPNKEQFPTS